MKLIRFQLSLIIIFVGYSCSFFGRPNFPVEQYEFSGLKVVFAELEDSYKRSKTSIRYGQKSIKIDIDPILDLQEKAILLMVF